MNSAAVVNVVSALAFSSQSAEAGFLDESQIHQTTTASPFTADAYARYASYATGDAHVQPPSDSHASVMDRALSAKRVAVLRDQPRYR
jgi:hypothetical protein